ncbi:MAG: transporter substrate-binding domain-containing protein [Clostridia bacterium]|nr:transporter substrate-binding domain-containing protein [Clostridia bacterium]
MKKVRIVTIALILVMALAFAFTSCKKEPEDNLAKIKKAGKITIAMEGTWAPWTYHDENDKLVGYDTEVGMLIAEKLGVEAEFLEGMWDGLLAGLETGRYDLMINGVGITEERKEKYYFSDPYAYNKTAVIVRSDNEDIKTLDDLKGKKTANTISSTYAELAESYGAEVIGVDDLNATLELLLAGRIDATLNAEVSFYDYLKEHPDAPIKIAYLTEDATAIGIPMQKTEQNASLLEAVNKALKELAEEGKLTELSIKYFGTDISKLG